MSLTDEKYSEVQEIYVENLKEMLKHDGGLYPHLTIFGNHIETEDDNKTAIVHVPIPGEFMINDETKDEFVNDVMPVVFKSIKEKFIPYGIAWASEAWIRIPTPDFDINKDNYKQLPIKKEVLIITMETETKSDLIIYEMKRKGTQVNNSGEFTHRIELIHLEEMNAAKNIGGRFSGLYKKLNKHEPI